MELAHSSEGYPIPALSPVDEAGLISLPAAKTSEKRRLPDPPRSGWSVTVTLRFLP
jgi:hypothetical protein